MGIEKFLTAAVGVHERIASDIPQLKRGLVWCHTCGRGPVKVENGLKNGWPKCCGFTMSIDSPEEREALKSRAPSESP